MCSVSGGDLFVSISWRHVVEVPVDIGIDENPGDHDDAEFQQPNPFRKSMIWHPQEIFHDLELKSGGNKRTEKQVAFKRGLFSRYLPELQVLVYQLMKEQEEPSGRKRKTRGNSEKSGAVWRACAYAYWHFHFLRDDWEDLPDRIVNIEDDGACNKEPFCLRSAQLPTRLLTCLDKTTKSGCTQKNAEAEWDKIKAWTKKFKETALAAKAIDPGAVCQYAKPTSKDRSCFVMPGVLRQVRSLGPHFVDFIHQSAKDQGRKHGLPWLNTGNNPSHRFGMATLHLHWSGEGDYLLPHTDVKQKDTIVTVSCLFGATLFMYVGT